MATTTPNKETIRRLCVLQGANECYINIKTGDEFVEILTNIKTEEIKKLKVELESWTGIKFRVFNMETIQTAGHTSDPQQNGIKILPIT